ncbi:helix-turn-helix domain-containing protein [Ectothiorhodospiraceae bacterium 2226]|nr:helix-turn-helix domain-containing protein [Ectothiorhodospiraceae bacterium 2226]
MASAKGCGGSASGVREHAAAKYVSENYGPAGVKGLPQRIAMVADVMGKKELARRSGISESQLYRYIGGQSQPTVEPLVALAAAAGVSIRWLVSGEGPVREDAAAAHVPAPLEGDRLSAVLEAVERALAVRETPLTPHKKAELVVLLYEAGFGDPQGAALAPAVLGRLIRLVHAR